MKPVEYLDDGHPVHRTWFKVVFNPVLRKMGWSIVSHIDEGNQVVGYSMKPYPEYNKRID
jgi:hypothetical protein